MKQFGMDEVACKNAVRCTICGSPADRMGGPEKVHGDDHPSGWFFQCQSNPGHVADGMVCIFSDLSYEPEPKHSSRQPHGR